MICKEAMDIKAGLGLGKGLHALFEDSESDTSQEPVRVVKISEVEPNKHQPRKEFDTQSLEQLADSIRQYGLLQPLLVVKRSDNVYMIVAGERRWRACRMAGIDEIPVIIKDASESMIMELSLIENLQREDLNPVEEALGYKELAEKYSFTQEEIATKVGKSRSAVTNSMRILNLPKSVLEMLKDGKITTGHARALLSLPGELCESYARLIVSKGLSVRDIERRVNEVNRSANTPAQRAKLRDSYYDEVEIALKEYLGSKVKVVENKGKGKIEIEFTNMDQLKTIMGQLSNDLE